MARVTILMLLSCLAILISCSSASENDNRTNYVEDACSVTYYRTLCIGSLSSFSRVAEDNPWLWARAGVSVTIGEAKRVARYLATLKKNKTMARGRYKLALSDCVECFQDTRYLLHQSLYVLRNLSISTFTSQLDDVVTWVSAALTDEDTCVDGLNEAQGRPVESVTGRFSNVSYMTSNALALINKLATAGPKCLLN